MSTSIKLSKIEKVDLRAAWQDEANDFTPWLASEENIGLLADALGLNELEVKAQEEHVGPFRFLHPLCTNQEVGSGDYSAWAYSKDDAQRKSNQGFRIDYFLASELLMVKVLDSSILNRIDGSDHCPILLNINY